MCEEGKVTDTLKCACRKRRRWLNKTARRVGMVIRGMLFIGFTVQILLGLVWMAADFLYVQDFGEPETALYRTLTELTGGCPQILYLLQLGTGFGAVSYFLRNLGGENRPEDGKFRRVWQTLALMTYPFAMQCHMAVLPFSLMGSLLLLLFSFLLQILFSGKSTRGKGRKRRIGGLLAAVFFCGGLTAAFSGVLDPGEWGKTGRSVEAAMASRFAWPTMWNDQGLWDQELQDIVRDVLWESGYCPGNMEILKTVIEERVEPETARKYYLQMAETGWRNHAPMVIRQIGWDVLGYLVTPVIFQLQLGGEAYDSYTGRNYEAMRGHWPVLTRNYVNYGCWWFAVSLFLAVILAGTEILSGRIGGWKRPVLSGIVCMTVMGILTLALTMRGAGIMDYKYTVAAGQLWLALALLSMRGTGREGEGTH